MKLYGVCGKKGSGKDTSSEIISLHLIERGYSVKTIAFADELKKMCARMSGLDESWFYDHTLKETPFYLSGNISTTPRELMQTFGTEYIQKTMGWKDFWVEYVRAETLLYDEDEFDVVLVTDVRFDHEERMVREFNGKMIHVTKNVDYSFPPNVIASTIKFFKELKEHSSEKCSARFIKDDDIVIPNSGTIQELRQRCNLVANQIISELKGNQ